MRLFIAEKPSLARAIADVLPKPQQKRGGYIECGADNVVAWCAGHILKLAEPECYAPEYKTWSLAHLPIVPTKWQLSPTAPGLLQTLKGLLTKADAVVHAGDPDREGQLLVDEVLEFLGYRGPVERLLFSDLNPPAVRKALGSLQPNANFRPLYQAALARQRADWLYGLNMTRLYTVLGRAGGHDGVLSVGRVQTPLLGLIVRRDLEIEKFQPKAYYLLRANVASSGGEFGATWQPGVQVEPFLDDARRLVSRDQAVPVQSRAVRRSGAVTMCSREKKAELAPLPFSLAELQIDAGKRLGLSPKEILDACQALYEIHRLTTYPRSDCSYLPAGHFDQASSVVAAVAKNATPLAALVGAADTSRQSRAWNDAKVTAHHAIIPTPVVRPDAHLTASQRSVYDLIARRYLAQFYPPFEFHQTQIEITVNGETFAASGRQPLSQGWRRVLSTDAVEDRDDPVADSEEDSSTTILPILQGGESVTVNDVKITDKKTTPPQRFTDATLVQAMTGIARFVTDPKIKQLLKETDGIGTPATQAQIIQTLFDRRFIEKKGRKIVSTAIGRALVQILPEVATTADMTALWEAAMRKISDGEMPLETFLGGVLRRLHELVNHAKVLGPLKIPGARPCRRPGCAGNLRRVKGKNGVFSACSLYPGCKYVESEPDRTNRPTRMQALSTSQAARRVSAPVRSTL